MDKPVSAGDSGRQVGPSWAPGSWGQSRHKGQVHGAGQQPAPPTPGPCWLALGAREGRREGPEARALGACSALQWWEVGLHAASPLWTFPGLPAPPSPSLLSAQVPKRGEPVAWASPKTKLASKLSFPFYSNVGGMGPKGEPLLRRRGSLGPAGPGWHPSTTAELGLCGVQQRGPCGPGFVLPEGLGPLVPAS